MKVSIITVVYNNKETIANAIESVIAQSYPDIEYIIVDGASTDGTLDIIKQYTKDIDVFVSEPDNGIYNAMNKGLRLATGDVVGILNSDDLFASDDVISTVMTVFNSEQHVDLVYGDLVYVKREDVNHVVRTWKSEKYYPTFFEDGHVPPHTSLFIKNAVYKRIGLFNEELRLAADYEIMLRIFKSDLYQSKYIHKLMIKMRLGGSTNKSIKNIIKGNKEILQSWRLNGYKAPLRLMPLRIFKRLIQFF